MIGRSARFCLLALLLSSWFFVPCEAGHPEHGTEFGEIEVRPSNVIPRSCTAGPRIGQLCNSDAVCEGFPCPDSNIFNLSFAVRFNATPPELQIIETSIQEAAAWLFDATDGQLQIGTVTIWNNTYGLKGHVAIDKTGTCQTQTGTWGEYTAANTRVNLASIQGPASCLAHELSHLIFDVRDEYKTELPDCGGTDGSTKYCPVLASGEETCLMECCQGVGTEFCWGQADPQNLTDISGGNHDPDNSTQQSICRNNRSCWDQIGWSWPNTFLVPSGPPDPAANGLIVAPVNIQHKTSIGRLVLVLDTSGSMGLDLPSRMDRLKNAALDVVTVAEDDTEIGIVSFSNVAVERVPLAPFDPVQDPNRLIHKNAILNLNPYLATSIGEGLRRARHMIHGAGGVTGDTAILLMTDGVNNRPLPDPAGDLQNRLNLLKADGIPVFVTCTGDDPGIASQCVKIASFTGGTYVDSSHPGGLPEAFTGFYELAMGRVGAGSIAGTIVPSDEPSLIVEIEPDARVATFVLHWDDAKTILDLQVDGPGGASAVGQPMAQGRFVRINDPAAGTWTATVLPVAIDGQDEFTARAYVANPQIVAPLALRHPKIQPGESFQLRAYPSQHHSVAGAAIAGTVERPDGTVVPIVLLDDGDQANSGDERPGDGEYSVIYTDTAEMGPYTFRIDTSAVSVTPVCDPGPDCPLFSNDFHRETRITGTVDDTLRDDCPRFDPPTPADGTTLFVDAGDTLNLPVQASHASAAAQVTLGHLGLPAGATFSQTPGNPAAGSLQWTTNATDEGNYAVNFTATDGSCTMASSVLVHVTCDAVCISVAIGAEGGEPVLTMEDPADCAGGLLPGLIDLVRSNLADLTGMADQVDLGPVDPVACDVADEKHGFCTGRLEPGQVQLFLARNTGDVDYGSSSAELPRIAASGDCP